jgi:hypothetical protein
MSCIVYCAKNASGVIDKSPGNFCRFADYMAATSSIPKHIANERRRSHRRPHVAEAFLSSPTGGQRIAVASIDLSKHGIGLSIKQPIAAGTYQILELGMGSQKMVSEVRILSCRPGSEGSFHVHATFC